MSGWPGAVLPGDPPHAGDTLALYADGSEVEDARNGGVAPQGATDAGRRPAPLPV